MARSKMSMRTSSVGLRTEGRLVKVELGNCEGQRRDHANLTRTEEGGKGFADPFSGACRDGSNVDSRAV